MAVYTMPGGKTFTPGRSVGLLGVLAPKGWTCKTAIGANGSEGMAIFGPQNAEVEFSLPNGQGQSVTLACPYFTSAQAISPCAGSSTDPAADVIGETVKHLTSSEVEVIDPPAVLGAGPLSGGDYTDESVVVWIPGSKLSGQAGQGKLGYAMRVDCALPQSEAGTCTAILNFASYWYASPSLAGF